MVLPLPRLPLGISDFAVLREEGMNYLYVDKTSRLLHLLDAGKYLFLARPRRFGKSLLCSTLKYLYEGRRELYTGLDIDPLWDWSKTNPVVHLSLTEASSKTPNAIYVVEFKLGAAADALAQITARRYYEPYRTDPRPIILLGAGGFADRAVQCLWEELAAARGV